jgi:putative endonuclease
LQDGHFVYLVRCADGSYYCGYARDPLARIQAHNEGRGSKILRGKLPVRLAYLRKVSARGPALKLEAAIKRRTHAEKRVLCRRWKERNA